MLGKQYIGTRIYNELLHINKRGRFYFYYFFLLWSPFWLYHCLNFLFFTVLIEPSPFLFYINDDGFAVAGGGGAIRVKKVQPSKSGKMKSAEFISSSGLKIGDRLGE